jgi:hypothetical protein
MTDDITSPEDFFGHQLGADRKIARWDKIVEYFNQLEKESDKIKIIDMGPSTEGNTFLHVIISSPENLDNLDRLKEVNAKISDPRGLTEEEVKGLINEGIAHICQSMSLHATEIAGTQMAPELAYDLLNQEDEETQRILDNVVFHMIPCFNPDGQLMVTDWYNQWLGTEYEGCYQPWLYHKYVGHDNNRDAWMSNMIESKYACKIMYRDWHPQAFQDHHHMGSYGARLYVSPYCEPIHPHADPLIWRELSWYGSHMAYRLEEEGKTGILNNAQFLAWGHLGFHWLGNYHNIASMLTENASAKLATPLYIHPDQLQGDARGPIRGFPEYKAQTNFPHPWPGGWWRLRDIVEQVKISAWALLDMAARNKDIVLWNAYLKAKRQTERGKTDQNKAFIIPAGQHDPLTTEKMIENLLIQGVEIHKAWEDFVVGDTMYKDGSYVIFPDQPKRGVVKTLLERTRYPDGPWTRERDGKPSRPQDSATDTMAEYMGVRVDPVTMRPETELVKVEEPQSPSGEVRGETSTGYVFDARLNDSFRAANLLLDEGVELERFEEGVVVGGIALPAGAFLAPADSRDTLLDVAEETGVDFIALSTMPEAERHQVERMRVAMYQRYWGGNMDEGWTRWLFEQFNIPYTTVMDDDIKKGNLNQNYDVLIFPDDSTTLITGEGAEEWWRQSRAEQPMYPEEYRSGIGDEGVEAVKEFVEKGGTLLTFGEACNFAIEKLDLRIKNALEGTTPKEFFCPGSTLHATIDNTHPLGYGMPGKALILQWTDHTRNKCPILEIQPSSNSQDYKEIVKFPEGNLLESGWLIGEEKITGKTAMVSVKHKDGKAVLIAFRPQNRAQTHGTFKLVFNTLIQ